MEIVGDEDDGIYEPPKRGPMSVYSKTSYFRKDLRKKGVSHLTQKNCIVLLN